MKALFELASGIYNIWPEFGIEIPVALTIYPGKCYRISGTNGAGKSSLLKKVILPRLQNEDCYYLYLEQQMLAQLYAVKAHAALNKYPHPVDNDEAVTAYLLDNLQTELLKERRTCCFVIDESAEYTKVVDFIALHQLTAVIFIISHDDLTIDTTVLQMETVNARLSRLVTL